MKSVLGILLLTPVFLCAQDPVARAACGPNDVQFSVKTSKDHAPTEPENGKALVYMFAIEQYDEGDLKIGKATTRVAVDGKWVGANRGSTYIVFSVAPGPHHICTNWQSSIGFLNKLTGAIALNAVAGETYYLRTRVDERTDRPQEIRIEHIDPDDAESLISSSTYTTSQVKQ